MNFIFKLLNKLFYNPYKFVNKHQSQITVGKSILTKQFKIRLSDNGEQCVEIGNNSILECSLIFEKESGKIKIGNNTFIGNNTQIISVDNICIANNVQISWGVTLYDHNGYSMDFRERRKEFKNIYKNFHTNNMLNYFNWDNVKSSPIIIEDDVWIGFGVTILKGVKIGKGAIVGAKSVVTKDVEPFTIVAGNPAIKIRDLNK